MQLNQGVLLLSGLSADLEQLGNDTSAGCSANRPMNCREGWIESDCLRPAATSSMRWTMDRAGFLTSISLILTGLRTLREPRSISAPSGPCDDSQGAPCRRGPSLFCDSPPQYFQDVEHRAEQSQGQTARRDPQTGDLDAGRFAAACLFI